MAIRWLFEPLSFAHCIGRLPVRLHEARAPRSYSLIPHCNIEIEVSKAVLRLKNRGIEPTSKELRLLWKKEIQKAKRREKDDQEKAEKVRFPVWYEWSEEDVHEQKGKLTSEEAEEDTADEFLRYVGHKQPARRIVMKKQGAVGTGIRFKAAKKIAVRQRRSGSRRNMSNRQMESSSSRDWEVAHTERLKESAENPIIEQNPIIREQETARNFQDTSITNISNNSAMRYPAEQFRWSGGITRTTASQDESGNENDIETFLDDEDDGAAEEEVVWANRNGRIKRKKSPAPEDFREMLLSRRKGDLSYMKGDEFESEDCPPHEDSSLPFEFDGRSLLTEDRKIQKLAARYIFTTLLAVLGKAHRPVEALDVFTVMREEFTSYPDIAAYHTIAVTLGQTGYLKELLDLIEVLKAGPKKPMKTFVPSETWDPSLLPDIVVYNAVLNACIPNKEWTCVVWTWNQFEKCGISPNNATFGLTIEAMVKAEKYEQAIRFYRRMERAGFLPNAQTYKCLVEIFGKSGKADEAIELVKQMEASGVVGTASVYYALACSLCISGRLQEALDQVRIMQQSSSKKPVFVTYTGLIMTCKKAGRIEEAISLFKHMQQVCAPNVDACNVMIKVYGQNKMFEEAKAVYEAIKRGWIGSRKLSDNCDRLCCNLLTFDSMLKTSATLGQWDYFECVYREMISQGYHLSSTTSLWLMLKVANEGKIGLVDDMIQRLQASGEAPDLSLYKAQILSCIHEECFHKAVDYINDMASDGYEVESIIRSIRKFVNIDEWKIFSHHLNSTAT